MLTQAQLTGCEDSHIRFNEQGVGLQAECWEAFRELQLAAREQGFDLQIASGFRSFERQLAIWNGKVSGQRPLYDEQGVALDATQLDAPALVQAILRFSALPGASRHHWGTDVDVYDAAAVAADYVVQLSAVEVADSGVFGPLHRWLDGRIERGDCCGFVRPYTHDHGGIAPERWHLSYVPLATACQSALSLEVLQRCLQQAELELGETVLAQLAAIYRRCVELKVAT